jgi:hypothetical protein
VVCLSFLASVVKPIVEICAHRMRTDRLTYDDLNEVFWFRCAEIAVDL